MWDSNESFILMKIIFISFYFLFIVSCSHISNNFISKDEIHLKGGTSHDRQWNDHLIFQRTSWFKEITLLFDTLIAPIDLNSPFSNWLSNENKQHLSECSKGYYALIYSLNHDFVSEVEFLNQIRGKNLKILYFPRFKRILQLHADFTKNSLDLYRFYIFCSKKNGASHDLQISIPGYPASKIFSP